MIELTKDQQFIFEKVMERCGATKNSSTFFPNFKYLTIGGLAGTGKTFLISILRNEMYQKFRGLKIAFVTFTGKASSVLKNKLVENESYFEGEDFVGTIHSLIYIPVMKYDKNLHKMVIDKWEKKTRLDFNLIFVDEASMVNKQIWDDLISYNIPIIAIGDHGQLPPIGDSFSLMTTPNYLLTQIKRQALNNPIIRLTIDIRNGKEIPYGFYDQNNQNVFKLPWNSDHCKNLFDKIDFSEDDLILLCATNKTRVAFNNMVREKLGYNNPEPYPGEKIIFLKNNYESKVLNGMMGKNLFLLYEDKNLYNMTISLFDSEEVYSGSVFNGCFGKQNYEEAMNNYYSIFKKNKKKKYDVCDYGYCISVHKSQGSEFKKVICYVEKGFWDGEFMKRWLYTACTRAKEKLFLIE